MDSKHSTATSSYRKKSNEITSSNQNQFQISSRTRKCIPRLGTVFVMLLLAGSCYYVHVYRYQINPDAKIYIREAMSIELKRDMEFNSIFHPMVRHQEAIVPNIVHFIFFGKTNISFTEMVCILAVHVNHRPDAIWIHCSHCVNGTTMGGKYWDLLMARHPPVEVRHIVEPTHIFGKELSSAWQSWHGSDIARILILMEHGGIYLDNDVYVINCLDHFRHYEMSLGWHEKQSLGNQVLVAHRNARFLRLYYDTYRFYNASLWYYNAGQLPTNSVLIKKPYLVHRVFKLFGVHMKVIESLYNQRWADWQDYFAVHLFMRIRNNKNNDTSIEEFNETNIRSYNRTYGEMVRLVLFNTTDLL